ncbi:hypothetical protein C8Q80DRAFT_1112166 [Daedaleopsis nitida]|nr:hypothetical protein C8Q80DRAFT_1112166 [Daedaleopsis nitida]
MAQKTADRHAARLKAIQEAHAAQLQEDQARATSVVAAQPPEMNTSDLRPQAGSSTSTARIQPPQAHPEAADVAGSDDFHFPSEDDAYFANLDMDALDEGVGRPIDYDDGTTNAGEAEGHCDISVGSVGVSTTTRAPLQPLQPQQQQQRTPPQQAHTSVSEGSGRAHTSNQNQRPPLPNADPAEPSSNSERPRTPSMGGGFSFPAGGTASAGSSRNPTQMQSRGVGSSGSLNSLKRNADIMQGINAGLAQARSPQQGMGLQNPAGGAGVKREPFAALEVGEGGDVKRLRRQ